jgi:PAS domain S-box-containing protein
MTSGPHGVRDDAAAWLAAIVESSDDAIIGKNLQGVIRSWNPGAERLFGYRAHDVIGQPITILFPAERLHEETEFLRRIRAGQRIEHYETVRVRKDGAPVDVSITLSPIAAPGGAIVGASKIARDITRHKEAENRLRAQEKLLRITLHSIGDAVLSTDSEGCVTFMNPVAERLTGWTEAEAFGRPVERVFHIVNETTGLPPDNPVTRALREGMAMGLANHTLLIARDGARRPIDDSAAPILDDAGRAFGAVLVFRDVTAQRHHERDLQLLAGVVASSGDAIVSKTLEGVITSWSPGAERMFGYTREEAIGESITLVVPPDREAEESALLARVREGEHVAPFETVRVANDGRRIDVELTTSPVRDSEGQITGASQIARDISDRQRAEEMRALLLQRAETARDEAATANRSKDQFLAVLSHELRTPLAAMLGWTQMLRNRQVPAERTQHALDVIHRNTVLQARLIDDLLDVARIEAGKLHLDTQPVQLVPLIEGAVETVQRDAAAQQLDLGRQLDPEAGVIFGDPARVEQIVVNLLSNAVKFTPPGGRIDVSLDRDGDHARIVVTDTGIGIKADAVPHIFERFTQVGSGTRRAHGGLGLGLAIVRHLVQLHGGSVSADSRGEGQGATFTVRLPMMAAPIAVPARPTRQAAEALALDGIKVVVVEDDPDAAEMVATVLRQHRAEVIITSSGAAALSLLAEYHPNVLVCDIGLPDIDGYALMERVRDLERTHGRRFVPSVALTAFASEEERQRAVAVGYQVHVSKPVEPERLVEAVAQVLAGSR